jgi:hypothetical protein
VIHQSSAFRRLSDIARSKEVRGPSLECVLLRARRLVAVYVCRMLREPRKVMGCERATVVPDRDVVLLKARLANHSALDTRVVSESRGEFGSRMAIPAHQMSQVTLNLFSSRSSVMVMMR